MERIQGPINSCFFGEHWEPNCLDQSLVFDEESLRLEEEQQILISSLLEDNMSFLQMLQNVEPSFQTLLMLQHMKNQNHHNVEQQIESCVTHEMVENVLQSQHSPVKSESNHNIHQGSVSASTCVVAEKGENFDGVNNNNNNINSTKGCCSKPQRKRKRARPAKNKEDVENQRMTHIAVERNRRRQMNDHLSVLRSLMPPSYIQRGDQASIIGGAIDFVKELEQLLHSLEAQKRVRKNHHDEEASFGSSKPSSSSSTTNEDAMMNCANNHVDEVKAEKNSGSAEIEVTMIQTHVNLKIQCQRRQGQLVKVIVALEDLRLSILHLNITTKSSEGSVLYSLNLKIEEGCKLSSANDIAEAVHHIFNFING